jgi:hypothetical protein
MKALLAIVLLAASTVIQAGVSGSLDNPVDDSTQSGIGIMTGWVCNANEVTVVIDNGPHEPTAYGNSRKDAAKVCGHEDSGFMYLWGGWSIFGNWSTLGSGNHRIRVYADGEQFADVTIYVGGFESNISGVTDRNYVLRKFPSDTTETGISWNESLQNFVVIDDDLLGEINLPDTGRYDSWAGLWESEENEDIFYQINQYYGDGEEIIFITEIDDSATEILSVAVGIISGNTADVDYFATDYATTMISNLTLVSPTRMRLDVRSCFPDINCYFKTGNSYYFNNTIQDDIDSDLAEE